MKTFFTNRLCLALACLSLLSACSRPVAYFQRTVTQSATAAKPQPAPEVSTSETPLTIKTDSQPASHINFSPYETYVRNDARLATNKKLQKRMDRLKHMLTASATNKIGHEKAEYNDRKMNVVERLMLKKVNKHVKKHLAPSQPEKALVNRGLLSGGAILFLGGLLLMLLTSGTAAVIGVIALFIGIIALILGLLAS